MMSCIGCSMSCIGCMMSGIACMTSCSGCMMSVITCMMSWIGCKMSCVGCMIGCVHLQALPVRICPPLVMGHFNQQDHHTSLACAISSAALVTSCWDIHLPFASRMERGPGHLHPANVSPFCSHVGHTHQKATNSLPDCNVHRGEK